MANIQDLLGDTIERAEETDMPEWLDPMLATLTDDYFSDPDWLFERKFDGERMLIYCRDNNITLYTRNQKSANTPYPELVDALEQMQLPNCILDGEIVAFDGDVTSFAKLQSRMHVTRTEEARKSDVAVYFYLFDMIYYAPYLLTKIPLHKRKYAMKHLISFKDPIRYTQHRLEHGKEMHQKACEKGWEGIIAKQADTPYVHSRSKRWLKFKCVHEQEFIIIGYTEPQGSRVGFGAVLIAYYEDDTLTYGGRIGTGFDDATLEELHKKFQDYRVEASPLSSSEMEKVDSGDAIYWLEPHFVCQAGFTEWTPHGKLRHPRYLGLRRDKKPKQVTREKPR